MKLKHTIDQLKDDSPKSLDQIKVIERKSILIQHIKNCFENSFQEYGKLITQHLIIFKLLILLFKDFKKLNLLEALIEKRNEFLHLQQSLPLYGFKQSRKLKVSSYKSILRFYHELNVMIFSSQMLPSDSLMLKLNNKTILMSLILFSQKFPDESILSQFSRNPVLDKTTIQAKYENPLQSSDPSTTSISQNLDKTMLLTASIVLSISAAALIFTLGPVAMVPCIVMGVIGLLSLIVAINSLVFRITPSCHQKDLV